MSYLRWTIRSWSLLLGVVLYFSCSCQPKTNCYKNKGELAGVIRFLELIRFQPRGFCKVEYLIVIPLDGCQGCVSRMLSFCTENISEKSITFMLSSSSGKNIESCIKNHGFSKSIILIDDNNLLHRLSISLENPIFIRFEDSRICTYEVLKPGNIDSLLLDVESQLEACSL